MTTKDEALKLALEALEMCRALIRINIERLVPIESPNPWFSQDVDHAITAIREALAQSRNDEEQPAQPNWNLVYLHSAMEYIREHHPQAYAECGDIDEFRKDRLKELEQPAQQEPVAWKNGQGNVRMTLDAEEIQSSVGYVYSVHGERIKNACIRSDIPNGTPLYTSPPASKPWVGLTDEEKSDLWCESTGRDCVNEDTHVFADSIEARLREKNA